MSMHYLVRHIILRGMSWNFSANVLYCTLHDDMAFSTIAVISIGEMGLGIAQLLMAHRYRVLTYAADRR